MSLKAKIEAVIYASEEPVTLAQLVGLLGEEAQAELDREVAAQQALALSDAESEAAEAVPELEPEGERAEGIEAAAEPADGEEIAMDGTPDSGAGDSAAMDAAPDPGVADAAAAKAEKARVAKLRAHFRTLLDALVAEYATEERGLEIREVAGGFRFATKPEYHDAVRGFVKSLKPPLKLSLQALETLAVVAYKQPVTSPEISEIRGVDSSGVLGSLIARKLITTAGRKHVIGRPILYKTTKEFLLKFGLKEIGELPSIEEFEKIAGQMAEQEEIPMSDADELKPHAAETAEELGAETEEYAPKVEEGSAADDVVAEDRASIDGRLASLPPRYDAAEDDPSAAEAEIQSGEAS